MHVVDTGKGPIFAKNLGCRRFHLFILERSPIALTVPASWPGFDPAIHHLRKRMDARVKPAHDGRDSGTT
jgi:hypothetical protein